VELGVAMGMASTTHDHMGVRTEGQMGSADPRVKMDEKLKSEKNAK